MNNRSILLISSLSLLAACSAQHEDLREWMQKTEQDAKQHIQPFEQPTVNPMVTYIPPKTSGMNFFNANRLNVGLSGANAPNTNRPKEVLENFSLENLKYVGSFKKENQVSAFIEADGHVYTVKPGNYAGQNFGRITSIQPDKLILSEVFEDTYGNWQPRNTELPLNNTQNQNSSSNNSSN